MDMEVRNAVLDIVAGIRVEKRAEAAVKRAAWPGLFGRALRRGTSLLTGSHRDRLRGHLAKMREYAAAAGKDADQAFRSAGQWSNVPGVNSEHLYEAANSLAQRHSDLVMRARQVAEAADREAAAVKRTRLAYGAGALGLLGLGAAKAAEAEPMAKRLLGIIGKLK